MQLNFDVGLSERLKAAAAARLARLSSFKPKPTRTAAQPIDSAAERAAELEKVRQERSEAKAAKRDAAAEAIAAEARAVEERDAEALELKRGARRERKALSAAEAKAKRDARYAARKARR